MPLIRRALPWTRQPSILTVNSGDPLGRDMAYACVPGLLSQAVRGRGGISLVSGATVSVRDGERVLSITATGGSGAAILGTAVDHSYLGVGDYSGSLSYAPINVSGTFPWPACANTGSSSIGIQVSAFQSVLYLGFDGLDVPIGPVASNQRVTITWVRRGDTITIYRGASDVYTASLPAGLNLSTGLPVRLGSYGDGGFVRQGNGVYFHYYAWPRALSASEAVRVNRSPWSVFAYQQTFLLTDSGILLPTLSLATFAPGSITSSGFRPRVTAA